MKQSLIMAPSTQDEYINLLPNGTHKFKHQIIVKRDYTDLTKVFDRCSCYKH
jgi:hypothetical protein